MTNKAHPSPHPHPASGRSANRVFVVGVGMTKFEKPGRRKNEDGSAWDYPDMARESGTKALADAGIDYREIEQAYVGYVYGESTSGQRAVYELGLTGIPVVNVNNNCSTGSTALYLAAQSIRGGLADCTLALGFEKMQPGSLGSTWDDREQPMARHIMALAEISEVLFPVAPWMFGAAGREHMKKYGTTAEHFAKIGYKNHKHSVNNPYSQFQDEYSLDDILGSRMIYDPLTKLQCSPTSDGSGAVVLASEEFVDRHDLSRQAVEIVGQAMTTDFQSTFDGSAKNLIGYDMNVQAAEKVYAQAGLGPEDFQVIELHDCFSANELLLYEALGLAKEGEAGHLIDSGATTYGGKWVVNPSGGLISKGHPLGATGLAQCSELTWQLRGTADKRQVDNVTAALQHNIGLGGAAVVTAYQRADR
ncbi:lipid-transfer protein [Nocardia sp. ET3-3]|uniref:propanoyl-CoA C-acyltransferase n=1 Tax=Nocardia terrae TaxID=2675851 RepID=A0A7K1UWN7_9NOCA|nr:lipid-transfer protein [Nocardia terrae]MVU78804.1 lipid-transfer protein [Nocardia terrae]